MEKKIAIMADIHGNVSSLKTVLKTIDQEENLEHIYCLGDLVGIGYETNEVLELLTSRQDISFVMGNHDEAIIDLINGREPYSIKRERAHHEWIASRLDRKFIPFLSALPVTLEHVYNGKNLLFLHYHLDEKGKFLEVDYEPTIEKLDQHYSKSAADIICFGHHHTVHYFKGKERLYLNPNSLGCNHQPFASFAILTIGVHGEVAVSLREVCYDNKDFLLGYRKLNIPDADYMLEMFHGNQHLKYI